MFGRRIHERFPGFLNHPREVCAGPNGVVSYSVGLGSEGGDPVRRGSEFSNDLEVLEVAGLVECKGLVCLS